MSRTSRRNHNTISLFPFLAVLVCVLGGLILLLVVNTRRMRMQGQEEVEAQQIASVSSKATVVPSPEPSANEPDISPPVPQFPRNIEAVPDSPPPPAVTDEDRAAQEALIAEKWQRIADLEQKLNELNETRRERQVTRAKLETLLEKTNERLAIGTNSIGALDQSLEQTRGEHAQIEQETLILNSEYDRLMRYRDQLERELEYAKAQQADVANRYAFVPYNGQKGTSRRPILIECTEQYIRFLPEDIRLTPRDLNGFTPSINPVLTGAQTLSAYWRAWHRMHPEKGVEDEPYVMLIVRPSGSVSYYIARKLLDGLNQPYGYELVSADWELDLAVPDPRAKRECQAAIDALMKQRDRIHQEIHSQPFFKEEPITLDQPRNRFDVASVESSDPRRQSRTRSSFDPNGPVSVKPSISSPESGEIEGGLSTSRPMLALEQPPARFPASPHDRQLTTERKDELASLPPEPGRPRKIADDERTELTPFDRIVEFPNIDDLHPDRADQPTRFGDGFTENRLETDNIANSLNDFEKHSGDVLDLANPDYHFGDEIPVMDGEKKTFGPPQQNFPEGKRSTGNDKSTQRTDKDRIAKGKPGDTQTPDQPGNNTPNSFGSSSLNSSGTGSSPSNGNSRQGRGQSSPLIMDLGKPKSRDGRSIDTRRWGSPAPGATIGYERELPIQIQDDRTIVGQVSIPTQGVSTTRKEFEESVVAAIDREVRSWPQPPNGFYWVPKVHFHIGEGGGGRYEQLHNELRDMGLSTIATHTSNETMRHRAGPASLRSGQSALPEDVRPQSKRQTRSGGGR
ncbi:MAG: hypothetical protein O2955_14850 [Planctomycetota bacterium]|nr:hypothetical protein [Planctomycetota bacterium]MDA1213792.1 hypothetical protein [Planctomycetota bacterium]